MTATSAPPGFHHEALLYSGLDDFLSRTTTYVRDGLEHGEPVLVVVDPEKIAALRAELGADARPSIDGEMGRGLWLANQLCDLVQLRRLPAAQVVRLHIRGAKRPSTG